MATALCPCCGTGCCPGVALPTVLCCTVASSCAALNAGSFRLYLTPPPPGQTGVCWAGYATTSGCFKCVLFWVQLCCIFNPVSHLWEWGLTWGISEDPYTPCTVFILADPPPLLYVVCEPFSVHYEAVVSQVNDPGVGTCCNAPNPITIDIARCPG